MLGVWDEVLQDDGDRVDGAAPGSEQHAPVVETLLFLKYPVDTEVELDEEVEHYGDEAACG